MPYNQGSPPNATFGFKPKTNRRKPTRTDFQNERCIDRFEKTNGSLIVLKKRTVLWSFSKTNRVLFVLKKTAFGSFSKRTVCSVRFNRTEKNWIHFVFKMNRTQWMINFRLGVHLYLYFGMHSFFVFAWLWRLILFWWIYIIFCFDQQ